MSSTLGRRSYINVATVNLTLRNPDEIHLDGLLDKFDSVGLSEWLVGGSPNDYVLFGRPRTSKSMSLKRKSRITVTCGIYG